MEYFEKLVSNDPYINYNPINLKILTVGPLPSNESGWKIEVIPLPFVSSSLPLFSVFVEVS